MLRESSIKMVQKMKLKLKLHIYDVYNTGSVRILFKTTAAIMMVFINVAVVSVNATAILATTENVAVSTTTMSKILLHQNASRNPIIPQHSQKSVAPQTPMPLYSCFPKPPNGGGTTLFSPFFHDKQNSKSNNNLPGTHSNNSSRSSYISNDNNNSNILLTSHNIDKCKSLTATWGDVDPNIFYLCDMQTKQPLSIRCPEGKGYFNGLGYSGCIPYDQWPACVAMSLHNQVHICDSDHMQQPWEAVNPNKFYICLQETTEPTLLNCGPGKGFVHATASLTGGNGTGATTTAGAGAIVGCANWEKWRSYMKCTEYY